MDPSLSIMNPEPKLFCRYGPRGDGPPKNLRQKSPNGSSSPPNGLSNAWPPWLTWVVETLTTTGLSLLERVTKSGRPCGVSTGCETPCELADGCHKLTFFGAFKRSTPPLIPSPISSATSAAAPRSLTPTRRFHTRLLSINAPISSSPHPRIATAGRKAHLRRVAALRNRGCRVFSLEEGS